MKIIPSRQLAASPGKVWSLLEEEGALVITRSGIPCGILLPTSEATLVDDLREHARRRAKASLSSARRRALGSGRDKLTPTEIAAEVAAVRRRQKRGGR